MVCRMTTGHCITLTLLHDARHATRLWRIQQDQNLSICAYLLGSHTWGDAGDGKCLQAHEILKLSLKRLALSCADTRGIAIPSNQLLIEPRHMRSDESRPGDLYEEAEGLHMKDVAMDLMVTSSLSKPTLL